MKSFTYVINDELGIHARPAGVLVKEAKKYDSKIILSKDGKSVEATKLMAVMGLAVKCGNTVEVMIEGGNEEAAYEGLKAFFETNLQDKYALPVDAGGMDIYIVQGLACTVNTARPMRLAVFVPEIIKYAEGK